MTLTMKSVLATAVLCAGMATAHAAERPGTTPKPVVTSEQAAAKAKKVTRSGAVAAANATADSMVAILHKYGL